MDESDMTINECYKRIDNYLKGDDYSPRFVNVHNAKDLSSVENRYFASNNEIIRVSSYAKPDSTPFFAEVLNTLKEKKINTFVLGISSFLKLLGEEELKRELKILASSSFQAHVVFLCFQLEDWLCFSDIRLNRLVYDIEGESSSSARLIFLSESIPTPPNSQCASGLHEIDDYIERNGILELFVRTKKTKKEFPLSLIPIRNSKSPYGALCDLDVMTRSLKETYGEEEEWKSALQNVQKFGSWSKWIDNIFGSTKALQLCIPNWKGFSDETKWIYFVALKLFGCTGNKCLSLAVNSSDSYRMLVRGIYRSLLNFSPSDSIFWELYDERKRLLSELGDLTAESIDFIQYARIKDSEELFYLTDLTQKEREEILELAFKYYSADDYKKLNGILKHIYHDLWIYTRPYYGLDEDTDEYFNEYKVQKVVNKISPDFLHKVEEKGKKRDFYRNFAPRAEIVASLNTESSILYFVDALGIEYAGFILECCSEKGIIANVHVGLCELPSITSINKDFLESFDSKNIISVKSIDDIKHHGAENFDYTKTKLPFHLIKELEVIRELIGKIAAKLSEGAAEKIFIISDHGASRLAVINEHETLWSMKNKGEHSGRCCPHDDADVKSEYAIEENGFWILANYDRFKGGRAADVEVHGGATLEEVLVPIIEFSLKPTNIEIELKSKLPIEVSYRKKAVLSIFSKTKLTSVSVSVSSVGNNRIKDKHYMATEGENNTYHVEMPDIKTAGEYTASVYSNGNFIADLKFSIKKEGSSENSIL